MTAVLYVSPETYENYIVYEDCMVLEVNGRSVIPVLHSSVHAKDWVGYVFIDTEYVGNFVMPKKEIRYVPAEPNQTFHVRIDGEE